MTTKALSTIIEEVEKQKTVEKQAKILQENSSKALKMIVGFAMDPTVKWLLPEGEPPHKPLVQSTDTEGRLIGDIRMLNYFVDSEEGRPIKQLRREQLFVQLLESVDPKDAKLLIRVKDKKLKIKKEAVKIAFPGISAHW